MSLTSRPPVPRPRAVRRRAAAPERHHRRSAQGARLGDGRAGATTGDVDSPIPAAYTYFGQFVDHDTTLEVQPADLPRSQSGDMATLLAPDMVPMAVQDVRNALRNVRTATLDLDSLYGFPAPRDPADQAKMRLGHVAELHGTALPLLPVAGRSADNDVPREGRSDDVLFDRQAQIGDPRNDENTIISQLQVAFLKAHNAVVDSGRTFEQARTVLRQHYQHVVVHDFLKRVCDPAVVDDVVVNGNRFYDAAGEPFFLPVEYSAAVYRFVHSMVRSAYDFNSNFNTRGAPGTTPASLELLFTFTALSGQLGFSGSDSDTVPENWVIQWENIIGTGGDETTAMKARRFDSRLAKTDETDGTFALFDLRSLTGEPEAGLAAFLAVRNLLRGYHLRLPTGQAVATRMGLTPLTPAQLLAEAVNPAQRAALLDGGFHERTPLWYYVLAEAGHAGGRHLGPVGSRLVAEVLVGLVRRSQDSILRTPGWAPSLPSATPGTFPLADLLRFAGVMDTPAPPTRVYTVRAGDTLTSIARDRLGDASRAGEVFTRNGAVLTNPDVLVVGQVLVLPPTTAGLVPSQVDLAAAAQEVPH